MTEIRSVDKMILPGTGAKRLPQHYGAAERWVAPLDCEVTRKDLVRWIPSVSAILTKPTKIGRAGFYFAPLRAVKYSTIAPTSSGATGAL